MMPVDPNAPQPGTGLKPTWRGLKTGGAWQTPLIELVGNFRLWTTEPNNFGRVQVRMTFDRVQVIRTDAPYPSAEAEIFINYSEQENSSWGKF
ncbi:hypothetical protein LCGC14_2876080, partial [marine sediment metagenome]